MRSGGIRTDLSKRRYLQFDNDNDNLSPPCPTSSSPGTVLTESMLCERLLLDSITGIDDPDDEEVD